MLYNLSIDFAERLHAVTNQAEQQSIEQRLVSVEDVAKFGPKHIVRFFKISKSCNSFYFLSDQSWLTDDITTEIMLLLPEVYVSYLYLDADCLKQDVFCMSEYSVLRVNLAVILN